MTKRLRFDALSPQIRCTPTFLADFASIESSNCDLLDPNLVPLPPFTPEFHGTCTGSRISGRIKPELFPGVFEKFPGSDGTCSFFIELESIDEGGYSDIYAVFPECYCQCQLCMSLRILPGENQLPDAMGTL